MTSDEGHILANYSLGENFAGLPVHIRGIVEVAVVREVRIRIASMWILSGGTESILPVVAAGANTNGKWQMVTRV